MRATVTESLGALCVWRHPRQRPRPHSPAGNHCSYAVSSSLGNGVGADKVREGPPLWTRSGGAAHIATIRPLT
jgi:hypothetical protein